MLRSLIFLGLMPFSVLWAPPPAPVEYVACVDLDFPPFEFSNADGHADGYDVEIMQAVARLMGAHVRFEAMVWDNAVREFEAGRVDFLPGAVRSPERSTTMAFSTPHAVIDYALFVRKGAGAPRRVEDLAGKAVLCQESAFVEQQWARRGFPGRLEAVSTERNALKLLARGQGDAAILSSLGALGLVRELGLTHLEMVQVPMLTADVCIAVPKDRKALLSQVDVALARLRRSGEYERIHRKWFGVEDPRFATRQLLKTIAWILIPSAGVLVLVLAWNRTLRLRVEARTRELRQHEARLEEEVRARTADLQQALDEVQTLSGMIPICAHCKRIRDDQGYWTQVEAYVQARTGATFTHGLCPACAELHFPEAAEALRKRKAGSQDHDASP